MQLTRLRRPTALQHLGGAGVLAGSLLLGALLPIVSIPVVTGRFGEQGWAVVAIAISLGGAAGVLVDLGWTVVGPQRVADPTVDRARSYREALAMRLAAAALCVPAAAVASALLAPADPWTAALLTVGAAGTGLLPTWFFTGTARPGVVVLTDGLPRAVAVLVAMLGIAAGAPLWVYGAALVAATVVAVTLGGALVPGPSVPRRDDWAAVPAGLRRHRHVIGARAVATTYTSLPAALIGAVAPGAVAAYALVDRPMRLGLTVAGAVPARLTSWLGSVPERTRTRIRFVVLVNAALGLVCAVGFRIVVPLLLPLVAPDIHIPVGVVDAAALTVLVACTNAGVTIALVATGRERALAGATIVAAVTGITGLLVLSALAGSTGAMAAVLVAETANGAWLAVALGRAVRRPAVVVAGAVAVTPDAPDAVADAAQSVAAVSPDRRTASSSA